MYMILTATKCTVVYLTTWGDGLTIAPQLPPWAQEGARFQLFWWDNVIGWYLYIWWQLRSCTFHWYSGVRDEPTFLYDCFKYKLHSLQTIPFYNMPHSSKYAGLLESGHPQLLEVVVGLVWDPIRMPQATNLGWGHDHCSTAPTMSPGGCSFSATLVRLCTHLRHRWGPRRPNQEHQQLLEVVVGMVWDPIRMPQAYNLGWGHDHCSTAPTMSPGGCSFSAILVRLCNCLVLVHLVAVKIMHISLVQCGVRWANISVWLLQI